MFEKSYVMVKPEFANNVDVIQEVMKRLTNAGLTLLAGEYINYTREDAQKHYEEHFRGSYENAKGFYIELEDYIVSDKAYGMIVTGENAIAKIRELAGSKNPEKGTIRYDIPKMLNRDMDMTKNVLHSSSSVEDAEKEIAIFKDLTKRKRAVKQANPFFVSEYENSF